MDIQKTAITEMGFKKKVGFCGTGKHSFAESPVTGLKRILNDMKDTVKKKLAVKVEKIANGLSEAFSAAKVSREHQHDLCGKISEEHGSSSESTFSMCEVIDGQVHVTHRLLVPFIAAFKKKKNRDEESESRWKQKLEAFVRNILERRIDSVLKWIKTNLPQSECLDLEVVTSQLNEFKERCVIDIFDRLRNQWKLCSQICSQRENECERCQRTCLKLASECAAGTSRESCDCLEDDHRCREDYYFA